jgi:DNA-directed RNA polymerase specialized sigma24 family protein
LTRSAADPALRAAFVGLVRSLASAHGLDPEDLEQQVWARAAAEPRAAHPTARLRSLTIQEFRAALASGEEDAAVTAAVAAAAEAAARVPDPRRPVEDGLSPEQLALSAERSRELRAAAARLPSRCPELVAALLESPPLSYRELAEELAMPRGSIGPTRARCLACLRRLLDAQAELWQVRPGG